ncbi:pyocin activator PrtN family protein [Brucella sp. NBRC 14130]|uniref:pyocin activator PrtN family protein n=1 Tax=Brucella sp. NBRC 14130 TaxID=3075483 RepID=UPI003340A270
MKKAITDAKPTVQTVFLLLAQYNGKAIISVSDLCRDYFTHLSVEKFIQKVTSGKIRMPLIKLEESQKSTYGVHLVDLAHYIDERRSIALQEFQQFTIRQSSNAPSLFERSG